MPKQGPIIDGNVFFSHPLNDAAVPYPNGLVPDEATNGILDLETRGGTLVSIRENALHITGAEIPDKDSFARFSRGEDRAQHLWAPGSQEISDVFTGPAWIVEMRVKIDQFYGVDSVLWSFEGINETQGGNNMMRVMLIADGSIQTFWEYGSGTNVVLLYPNTVPPIGQWFTIQARGVEAGGVRTVELAIDGVVTDSQSGTNATGGENANFGLLVRPRQSLSPDRGLNATVNSFHIMDTDIGLAPMLARSNMSKFTEVPGATVSLHNFTVRASQRDDIGNVPLMDPSYFTDPYVVMSPWPADSIVCETETDVGSSCNTELQYWMFANTDKLRAVFRGDFTFEMWHKMIPGHKHGFGLFGWGDQVAGPFAQDSGHPPFNFYFRRPDGIDTWFFTANTGLYPIDAAEGITPAIDLSEDGPLSHNKSHLYGVVATVDGAGFRVFDFYIDGVLHETVTSIGKPADRAVTQGIHFEWGILGGVNTRIFTVGARQDRGGAAGVIDRPRLSTVARSPAEMLETYTRGLSDCTPEVPVDPPGTPPQVVNVDPPSGVAGATLQPSGTLSFDIIDAEDNIHDIWLEAIFEAEGHAETIFDGVQFSARYLQYSKRYSIPTGYRYEIRRTGNWPSHPGLRIHGFDTKLNEVE